MIRRLCFVCIFVILMIFFFTAVAHADWTILVYMTGSDLESTAGAASSDLEEMISAIQRNDQLNVAVCTGGTNTWKNGISSSTTAIWEVGSDGLKLIEEKPAANMGEPETLYRFLSDGATRFPAENYALILWDHGGGPLGGLCFDEQYDFDSLNMNELTEALQASPFAQQKLSWIGFDACLMSSAEVASAVAPFADYMIASQEPEPPEGWAYHFLHDISASSTAQTIGESIINAYEESQEGSMLPVTLSCIDLSCFEELEQELGTLFGALSGNMTDELYQHMSECRVNSRVVGSGTVSSWDLVDLVDFLETIQAYGVSDTGRIQSALEKMIVYHYSSVPFDHGLSIYMPFDNKLHYSSPWSGEYASLDFSGEYQSFIQSYAKEWLEPSSIQWEDHYAVEMEKERQSVTLSIPLTDEESASIVSARLLVLETGFSPMDEYWLIWTSDPLRIQQNILTATYHGEALYILDENDQVIDGPLTPSPLEGGVATYAILEDSQWFQEGVYLIWMQDDDGRYRLETIERYNDELEMFSVSSRRLQAGDNLMIGGYTHRFPPAKDSHYQDWPWGDSILSVYVPYQGNDFFLRYLPMQALGDRVAVFELTDNHGNIHLSDPVLLPNPDSASILKEPQTAEDRNLSATLEDVKILTGSDTGLECNLLIQSESSVSRPDDLFLRTIVVNQTALVNTRHKMTELGECEGKTGQEVRIFIPGSELQKAGSDQIDTIGFIMSTGNIYNGDVYRFSFDIPLDPTGLFPSSPENASPPMARAEEDGVTYEWLSLRKDRYNDLMAEIRIHNHSGSIRDLELLSVFVNGQELSASLQESTSDSCVIPDGCAATCSYSIWTQTFSLENGREAIADIDPESVSEMTLSVRYLPGRIQKKIPLIPQKTD